MHYNEYPYPDPSFYIKDNAKVSDWRVTNVPTRETWSDWFQYKAYRKLDVLVVGCGTVEAIMVASTNPDFSVTGIDTSEASIKLASSIAEKEGVTNLTFKQTDIEGIVQRYDIVIASGVLHHIRDSDVFLKAIRERVVADGRLAVMVYGNYVRSFIPGFCDALSKLGLVADENGIKATRAIIKALPQYHPVTEWWNCLEQSDSELTDMWLNAYFTQYYASQLINTVEKHGFEFQKWLSDDVGPEVIDALPPEMDHIKKRFNSLSPKERFDVCQVLNNKDIRLTALFFAR